MGVPTYRPQLFCQLCFNAEPNDPSATALWVDYTPMVRKITPNKRGRQYELSQSMAASPTITWRDPNEIFNPANTSSAQYPNVEPYRQVLMQGMYPPEPVGSAVNLINSGRWKANGETAPDPSFESYANGAALPGWLTAVGATVPTVTTTNPQQGTKSLTYTVAGTATVQGVSWEADCVPGQQYTTSAYVRQSTGSTQRLLVAGQSLVWDNFGRSASSSWGSADSGQAYTNSGGSAADFSVSGGTGNHSNASTNVLRNSLLDSLGIDADIVVDTVCPVVPTGAPVTRWACVRAADTSNFYAVRMRFNTDATMDVTLQRCVAGAFTNLTTALVVGIAAAGQAWSVRLQVQGTAQRARIWRSAKNEPATWQAEAADTNISTGTNIILISRCETGNTNGTVVTTWDNLMVTGAIESTTTTTTGSYVRLTKTFTATQPRQTISVSTRGTATAGTINVDAIQHETGASASAFSTPGPVIFPLLRDYIERWPREYEAAGFVGIASTPAVDGFAALNSILIRTEYPQTVLSLEPALYWTLSGDANTVQALEISGNGGPPLTQFDSKYGPGNAPVFGAAMSVAGNPGGTGVRFKPTTPGGGAQPDSMLSLGRVPGSVQISFPGAYYSGWGASISCWVQLNDATANQSFAFPIALTSPAATAPIALIAASGDPTAALQSASGGLLSANGSGAPLSDLLPHHLVGTATQVDGGDTTVKLYVDGALLATATATTASLGGLLAAQANVLNVGGISTGGGVPDGVISDVALWNRVLSASEVATLWEAGGLGYTGETTGERWARHLALGRYTGATRISAGSTVLGPATQGGQIDLLSDGQQLALAELGTHWIAPDGADVFEGRQERWLRLTSVATFGEDTASGEIPYQDGVMFDYDPTFVYASVAITRNGGAVARGGTADDITAVTRKYFGRSYAIGADFEADTGAQEYADFVFNSHKAPLQRLSRISVDASSSPTLFSSVLLLEIGQRVTVKRRAKAANAGAGLTMSADYFIESVEHSEVDMDGGKWVVHFLLSPIGAGPGVTMQPWILENTTYGVLDATTVLGF